MLPLADGHGFEKGRQVGREKLFKVFLKRDRLHTDINLSHPGADGQESIPHNGASQHT